MCSRHLFFCALIIDFVWKSMLSPVWQAAECITNTQKLQLKQEAMMHISLQYHLSCIMWWTLVTCYRILQKPISSPLTCFYSIEQCAFLCEFNNATVVILITSPLSSCYQAVRGKLCHHYLSMGGSNSKALLLCTFCQTKKKPIFYWYQYLFHIF